MRCLTPDKVGTILMFLGSELFKKLISLREKTWQI